MPLVTRAGDVALEYVVARAKVWSELQSHREGSYVDHESSAVLSDLRALKLERDQLEVRLAQLVEVAGHLNFAATNIVKWMEQSHPEAAKNIPTLRAALAAHQNWKGA